MYKILEYSEYLYTALNESLVSLKERLRPTYEQKNIKK